MCLLEEVKEVILVLPSFQISVRLINRLFQRLKAEGSVVETFFKKSQIWSCENTSGLTVASCIGTG